MEPVLRWAARVVGVGASVVDVQGPAGWCRASPTSALVVDEDATE